MAVSIKKTLLMVILILALLAGLFGWSMRMAATSGAAGLHSTGVHSSTMLAWYCPPPPRYC